LRVRRVEDERDEMERRDGRLKRRRAAIIYGQVDSCYSYIFHGLDTTGEAWIISID
jgi:hypothetical protein